MPNHAQNWFIHTPIEHGEVLSSWLIRSGLDMGCSPLTLTKALWGKWRALTIDLDRGVSGDRLESLLAHSFEDKQKILRTMIKNEAPYLIKNSNSAWLLSLGQRGRSNFSGRQICPQCFESDGKSAYLRLVWRMGWHCCCEKHQTYLIDHCPNCGVVIQPFKIDLEHRSLAVCSSCHFNFTQYQAQSSDTQILDFQKNADKVLKQGSGLYNNQNISAIEWFVIARAWISEIRYLSNTKNIQLIEMFESFDINLKTVTSFTPITFEYLNTNERIVLLSLLNEIMKIPIELIIDRSFEYGISSANFWDKRKKLPTQLQLMKSAMMQPKRAYALHRMSSPNGQPKSRKTVQHKWFKLLRKSRKERSGELGRG